MSWLLELLLDGIREICSQFIVDMMELITKMFTELLSCDLSLFESLFSVVSVLYRNVIVPMGIAILLLILVWQLFKSMFGKSVNGEEPIELLIRSAISLFFVVMAKPLVNYVLKVAGTPYQWVVGTEIVVESFSGFVSALEGVTETLGITSDQDSTYDMLATLFTSFLSIKLVRFADKTEARKLPIPMNFILDEFPNIGVVPDFKKKLATARSRAIGMSILYQNIPQLQNRYPDNQWEEILGGCDFSIFLGCNDLTTATYFSDRTGEITVSVSSIRKNFYTIRATDYVPEYSESSSVGKRQLLLPDEVLRFPLNQGLLIIRGQNVLRFQKMDYTEHADAKRLRMEKVEAHIPNWYVAWEQEKQQAQIMERIETELDQREELQIPAEAENEEATGGKADGASAQAPEVLVLNTELPKNDKYTGKKSGKAIRKVEDLFSKQEGG